MEKYLRYWVEESLWWAEFMIKHHDSLKPVENDLLEMYKHIKQRAINSIHYWNGSISIWEETEEMKQVYYFYNLLCYIDKIRKQLNEKNTEQKEKEIFKKYFNKILDSFLDNNGMKTKD